RGMGEITFPASKALRLCADWDDALAFMRSRANLQDPDERLRLARWCEQQRLLPQALAEANAAVALRPAHAAARQLQALLQKEVAALRPTRAELPRPTLPPPLPLDIGAESLALFNNKVHPILMNTCVACHTAGRGGNFQLYRAYEGGQRAAMQRNIATVLGQIHMEQPALSPLLIKAASAHGNADQPPLQGGRQSAPYKSLENWVQTVAANNPHLREHYAKAPETRVELPLLSPEPRPLPRSVTSEGPDVEKPMPPAVRPVEHVAAPATLLAPGTDPARTVPVMPALNAQAPAAPRL